MNATSDQAKIPRDFEGLKTRLIEVQPDLPRRLQQVSAFALENPDEMAFGTAAGIAERADVQASTLVRFAQAIGYAGFSDLQEVFRSRLRDRWPDYSERVKALQARDVASGDPAHLLAGFADSAIASVTRLRESVPHADLDRAVGLLQGASTIYLLGQRRAFPVSTYLAYALAKLGVRAILIDNVGSMGVEQAANVAPGDVLIAISFAPYTPFTVETTREIAARGAKVVVITDSPLSPLAGCADVRFEVAENDFGSFRSLSATFCLAITLAVALANKRDNQA
jgi:DNA-binding MurR/RpiR family transcriptional regulator